MKKKHELILGRFEDITEIKKEEELQLKKLLTDESETYQVLKYVLPFIIDKGQRSGSGSVPDNYTQSQGCVIPTKRELEILQPIGEGYSTKQIANISINTVETHRRHLLEKLQIKNSMELIKRSTNAFWLKVAV